MTDLEKTALSFVIKDKIPFKDDILDNALNINGKNYISVETVIGIIKDCDENFIYQSFIEKYKDAIK